MNSETQDFPANPQTVIPSRRQFLADTGLGFGALALTHLLQADGFSASPRTQRTDLTPKPPHFPAQAKAVIQLFHHGGPSQMDLFDPKSELQSRGGQKHPEKVESFQPGSEPNELMASPFKFSRHGKSGMDFSELVPNMASLADEWCMVRSMHTENNNHPQGMFMINTGKTFGGRPSLGAWISYGLGTANQNLPAYVVLRDPEGYNNGGSRFWTNGWLPALYRGTEFSSRGAAVLNLRPGVELPKSVQRNNLDLLAKLNEERRKLYPTDTRLEARIRHYELAARMQLSAEEVVDLSGESEATRKLYGMDNKATANYGTRCLMARRLVESGVRFVQVLTPVKGGRIAWDHHKGLKKGLSLMTSLTDLPAAGLLKDLKDRGLLDSTLVIWTGEFGRLPVSQHGNGRDHNRYAFTLLMAGGGVKGGYIHGATDEFGYRSITDRVSVPDYHATVLHQLGLDHRRLAYPHNGRPETLTDPDVSRAEVVQALLKKPAHI